MLIAPILLTFGLTVNVANNCLIKNDYSFAAQESNAEILTTKKEVKQSRYFDENNDYYEDNDFYDSAVDITPTNGNTSQINAVLVCKGINSNDVDYFYFKVFSESYIDVQINSSSSIQPYTFQLSHDTYTVSSNNNYSTSFDNLYYSDSASSLKTYNSLVVPGTYFIIIDQTNQSPYYGLINYQIDLEITPYVSSSESYQIGDLFYTKNLQCAYWARDFMPIQHSEGFYKPVDHKYSSTDNDDSYGGSNYAMYDLQNITSSEPFLVEEFYLWGDDVKMVFKEIIKAMIDAFFSDAQYNMNLTREIEITKNAFDNTISVVCYVAGVASPSRIISTTASTIGLVWPIISSQIFDAFVPEVGMSDFYFAAVLGYYYGLLTDSPMGEVIYLPVYATLTSSSSSPLSPFINYYFTTKDTPEHINVLEDEGLWSSGSISTYNKGFSNLKGQLYTFINDQKVKISSISDSLPSCDVFSPLGGTFDIYFNGGYKWLEFSHTAGSYYFYFESNPSDDLFVEVFNNLVIGHSVVGRLYSYQVNATNTLNNNKVVFFNLDFSTGGSIYFRIRGGNYGPRFNINYGLGDISPYLNHVHIHNNHYEWYNFYNHHSFCDCGHSQLQPHVVSQSSLSNNEPNYNGPGGPYQTCLLCGGQAIVGLIHGVGDIDAITLNGSYITKNGIIVLVDEDLELFFKEELIFYNLDGTRRLDYE